MSRVPDHELIARHLAGEASPQDKARLAAWRTASPEHERQFDELASLWSRMEEVDPAHSFNVAAGWRAVLSRIEAKPQGLVVPMAEPGVRRFRKKPVNPWILWAGAAAMLVLVIGLGWFRDFSSPSWQEAVAGVGEQQTVVLPDGTTARMNAGSRLRWREGFSPKVREVIFSGHGFFQVVTDGRPFLIQTETARVRVVGTAFDVWARNRKTRVVVSEGRVALGASDGSGEVILSANQLATFADGQIQTPRQVDAREWVAWLEGHVVFRKQKLADVILDLEKTFGATLYLNKSELGNLSVTASFREAELETILGELSLTLGLKYQKEGDSYRITR